MKISKAQAAKVLGVVDKGLSCGLGEPKPGEMCVEAAVSFALGYDFGDQPKCVDSDLIGFKIGLNDEGPWKSNKDRARALRRIAIAQLGTKGIKNFWGRFLQEFKETLYSKWVLRTIDQDIKKTKPKGLERERMLFSRQMFINYRKDVVENVTDGNDIFLFSDSATRLIDDIHMSDDPDELLRIFTQLDRKEAEEFVEDAVQALKKLKTPGSKYLHLTE